MDRLFGILVNPSDCHPIGPGFDFQLYPRNCGSTGSGTRFNQPHEDKWVGKLLDMRSGENLVKKTEIKVGG